MHRVYLIAAEKDAPVAEELAEFLKRWGCRVRVEVGARLYPMAHPGEKTVALWSFNTRMSGKSIIFTNRAIDALVGEGLVVAQLDHHALPRGFSDVTPVNMSFGAARQMKYHDVRKALDALVRRPPMEDAPQSPDNGSMGGSTGGNGAEPVASMTMEACVDDSAIVPKVPELAPPGEGLFISYATRNSDIVYPLVDHVEALGHDVWIDRDDLPAGTQWAGNIVRAIKGAAQVCLMCSAEAFDSDHVRREVYLADKYKKPLLPVRLDSAMMPEDIEYFLIDRQWIDLVGADADMRMARIEAALRG